MPWSQKSVSTTAPQLAGLQAARYSGMIDGRSPRERTGSVEQAIAQGASMLAVAPRQSIAQAEAILEIIPDEPRALLLLAQGLRRSGQPKAALLVLERLATAEPHSAATRMELAHTKADMNDHRGAIISLRQALALVPTLTEAWVCLGAAYAALGDTQAAGQYYAASLRAGTKDPEMIDAALALADERLEEAEDCLRRRLWQLPQDVAAMRMLAELMARLSRYDEAIALLERCLSLHPGFDEARANLAQVLLRQGQANGALEQADRLLERHPGNVGWQMIRAAALARLGRHEDALSVYRSVLRARPGEPLAWMSYGHTAKTLGRQEEAVSAYRRAIATNPGLGEAWWSLANLKTVRFGDADIAAMRRAIADTGVGATDQLHLHFALGKACEDRGDDQTAFQHYAAGNALRRRQLAYSSEQLGANVDAVIETLERLPLGEVGPKGFGAPDPIFVVGMPRAGSTLIEQILASHSQVEGTMELPDIPAMMRRLRQAEPERPVADILCNLSPAERVALGAEYIERTRVQRHTDRAFFIDKMPNNWLHLAFIQLILPNARIVDARRDAMPCCWSMFRQHFARGQAFCYDLAELGAYYRDYLRLMAAYDRALPDKVIRVRHETLVATPDAEIRLLLDRLDLPFEADCLRFWQTKRAVRTASSEQVRQPIFMTGLDQWRRFDRWLGPLRDALGPILDVYPQGAEGF